MALYAVPTSARDRRPCGVLVPGVVGKRARVRVAIPYGLIGRRLYLPVDGRIDPDVTEQELDAMLVWDVAVFHPTAGLCGFARDDALRVANLISVPPEEQMAWDRAIPGVGRARRLQAVEAETPSSATDVLDVGRDDIGSAAGGSVPPDPGESKLRDALDPLVGPAMEKLHRWLEGRRKASGRAGGVAGQAQAGSTSRQWRERLDALRNRELDRLSKMLARDPDRGLMHALPLNSPAHRGTAPPGYRLGSRWPIFNLGWLRGGGPGDVWDVSEGMRQRLAEQYRHAANRELALGRYRRAAYVFGHLLGDFAAAADALRRGRHFRDAAVLYREKLRNPRAAAACLEAGGLIAEAIEAYEQVGDEVKAGDLAVRIDRPEEAERLYRAAVARSLGAGDPLQAARVLEEKLNRVEEALGVLAAQWPASPSAGTCLRAWFDLIGRLGRHQDATRRVEALRDEDVPTRSAVMSVGLTSHVARTYPDELVRRRACDVTLRTAGLALQGADPGAVAELTRAVAAVAPHDRLLSRDAERYADRSRRVSARPVTPAGRDRTESGAGRATMSRSFRLPSQYQWNHATTVRSWGFCAVGLAKGRLAVARATWGGQVQHTGLVRQLQGDAAPRVFEGAGGGPVWVVSQRGALAVPPQEQCHIFPPSGALDRLELRVFDEFGAELMGVCADEHGGLWTLTTSEANAAVLTHRDAGNGLVTMTRAVHLPPATDRVGLPLPMAVHRGTVFIGAGSRLSVLAPGGGMESIDLPIGVRALAVPAALTRTRVLALGDDGALLVRFGQVVPAAGQAEYERLGRDVTEPEGAFLLDGSVVLAGRAGGGVYRPDGRRSDVWRFDTADEVAAVLPSGPSGFAVIGRGGIVGVFAVTA